MLRYRWHIQGTTQRDTLETSNELMQPLGDVFFCSGETFSLFFLVNSNYWVIVGTLLFLLLSYRNHIISNTCKPSSSRRDVLQNPSCGHFRTGEEIRATCHEIFLSSPALALVLCVLSFIEADIRSNRGRTSHEPALSPTLCGNGWTDQDVFLFFFLFLGFISAMCLFLVSF